MNTYYATQRPISIGTHPKWGLLGFDNFDQRQYVPEIGREAWATLNYNRELTDQEMEMYELIAHPENSEN